MTDYNDAQLLSDVYTLLEEKKSQFVHSLEIILSKPLNTSVRILNKKLNVTDQYTEMFNVTTSFSYLLIVGDEKFTLNFTDTNENTIIFKQNPWISYYYSFYYFYYYNPNYYDSVFINSHLIKSPAEGSWTLNARGNGSLTVQILGFTGNCSDSDCHPNATCGEFGGDQQCTCKVGFAGDGSYCNDIDECQDYYSNQCNFYGGGFCVNTIGSYTCNCNSGFQYIEEFDCVDIDECADPNLYNCDPTAICTNNIGSYTCTCPYGYYGDGRHCEVNECQQGTPCNSTEECIKSIGSYSCTDPCSNHNILSDPWRSTSNLYNSWYCDYGVSGWYRFIGEYNQQIPEHCIAERSCGTVVPIWMNGSHPAVSDGVVNRTACSHLYADCCTRPFNISVRMCPEGFYVYKLQSAPGCNSVYCTGKHKDK
ncbi:uromodulin-like [Mantella aurantiaca]